MKRLVYAPKVWVYVRGRNQQLYDLSDYVVSGEVDRQINQVSSATVVLRNPDRVFTQLGNPAFLPMDPITIFLQRHIDKPVRVFTGWIDESPYYQMYPGTATIKASCTLKKLQYTFWDPALPFVMDLLTKLGWMVDSSNGLLMNPATFGGGPVLKGDLSKANITDGSMGKLLYTILNLVGGWDDQNIYIENLPHGLIQWIASMYTRLVDENALTTGGFSGQLGAMNTLLQDIIGTATLGQGGSGSSSGSSSGTGPPLSGGDTPNKICNYLMQRGLSKAGAAGILGNMQQENGFSTADNSGGLGLIQWIGTRRDAAIALAQSTGRAPTDLSLQLDFLWQELSSQYGSLLSYLKTATSATDAATRFCNEFERPGIPMLSNRIAYANSAFASSCNAPPATTTPKPTNSGTTTNPASKVAHASDVGSGTGPAVFKTSLARATTTATTASVGSGPTRGGTTASAGATPTAKPSINIANMFPDGVSPERIDEGVDYTGAGKRICAISDSDIVDYATGVYGPSPGNYMLLRFKDPPLSQGGCGSGLWYVSEMFNPTKTSGSFKAGDVIGTIIGSTGIEVGWASGGIASSCGAPQVPTHNSGGPVVSAWGKDFSNLVVASGSQPGTITGPDPNPTGGTPINDWKSVLAGKANFVGPGAGGGSSSSGVGGSGGGGGLSTDNVFQIAKGVAFGTELQWPSIADTIEAVALQGHKSLMNDKPLLSFVQQLASATMRSFQSAPNGDFFAFFPDYFGEFNHRAPYWNVHDIELITGDIQLTDAALVTHMYVVGDTLMAGFSPDASTQLMEKVLSAGTVDIYDWFGSGLTHRGPDWAGTKTGGYTAAPSVDKETFGYLGNQSAVTPLSLHSGAGVDAFLKRYGARPLELDEPLIRSSFYEAFLALQNFMLAWSQQFATDFTFTFMPELYPGGRVSFESHNITMYINSVTHSFDYETGFTTVAELSAPAATNPDGTPEQNAISWGMVNSLRS